MWDEYIVLYFLRAITYWIRVRSGLICEGKNHTAVLKKLIPTDRAQVADHRASLPSETSLIGSPQVRAGNPSPARVDRWLFPGDCLEREMGPGLF